VSQSFGYISKSGIAGSYGRSLFSFLSRVVVPKVILDPFLFSFYFSGEYNFYIHENTEAV
jgi:hypothetical protein